MTLKSNGMELVINILEKQLFNLNGYNTNMPYKYTPNIPEASKSSNLTIGEAIAEIEKVLKTLKGE